MNGEMADGPLVPFADSWKYKTLAECCYENFSNLFKQCMGDSLEDNELPPCSLAPTLSGLWYVKDSECVIECEVGKFDSCNGRATSEKELYDSFESCCAENLWGVEGSLCQRCSVNFWTPYFESSPDTGYSPLCKWQFLMVSFKSFNLLTSY